MKNSMQKIAVVGLGYVGLPLAVEFGRHYITKGIDLDERKIAAYEQYVDPTGEVSGDELRAAKYLSVTTDASALSEADFIVVAVPTPVDAAHQPDFRPLLSASVSVGKHMKRGAVVVFESTV
jgi:UDP-N-acetyl-D-galactosamine dehydrogenase